MTTRLVRLTTLTLAVVLLASTPPDTSSATTFREPNSEDFRAAVSTAFGRMSVESADSHYLYADAKAGPIYTEVRLRVLAAYHGLNEGDIVTVWLIGGQIGRVIHHVSGTPVLTPGDEVILRLNPARYPLFAAVQGDVSVKRVVETATGRHVLDHAWRAPPQYDSAGEVEPRAFCVPNSMDRHKCDAWTDDRDRPRAEPESIESLENFELRVSLIESLIDKVPQAARGLALTLDSFLSIARGIFTRPEATKR
jgi:hypothetical protein